MAFSFCRWFGSGFWGLRGVGCRLSAVAVGCRLLTAGAEAKIKNNGLLKFTHWRHEARVRSSQGALYHSRVTSRSDRAGAGAGAGTGTEGMFTPYSRQKPSLRAPYKLVTHSLLQRGYRQFTFRVKLNNNDALPRPTSFVRLLFLSCIL